MRHPTMILMLSALLLLGAPARGGDEEKEEETDMEKTHVVLTLSGGGVRAASFGCGVVRALREMDLLEELDLVSGVSGGSLMAAWLARDRTGEELEAFREKVLLENHEKELVKAAARAGLRLLSSDLDRTQIAARYWDELFGELRIGNLPPRPRIVIQATHLATGRPFPFTPETLAHLHKDPESFPLGTAIGASAAFPGAFPPLPLELEGGHAPEECPGEANCSTPLQTEDGKPVATELYLADGGVADNLGLNAFLELDELPEGTERLLVIVVNSRRSMPESPDLRESILESSTWMLRLQQRIADANLLARARDKLRILELKARLDGRSLATHLTLIRFDESEKRDKLNEIPTRLHLDEEEVDLLIEEGATLLKDREEELDALLTR